MADIHLDWSTATPQEGDLLVNLSEVPDQEWVDAFLRVSAQFGSETRGQTWDRVVMSGDHRSVVVEGLGEDGNAGGLRDYVDALVGIASREAPRERSRVEQQRAQEEAETRRRHENASRIADELRKPLDSD